MESAVVEPFSTNEEPSVRKHLVKIFTRRTNDLFTGISSVLTRRLKAFLGILLRHHRLGGNNLFHSITEMLF
jgi:hypothetical protein